MNDTIFYFFYNFAHQSATGDGVIVFFAQTFPYLVIFLAGLLLLFHHDVFKADNTIVVLKQKYKEILMIFFSGIIAWILSYILKFIFATSRPFEILPSVISLFPESDHAFPSGHSAFFMALAVTLYFIHKKIGYLFIFFALLIGLARIMAGVHFPVDILGGFILGAGIAYLVAYFQRKM